ncbi:MAG: preprotein translocase subunit SecY [Clostridia bacterium]|nr:preprotein translocase subunit SecY [Clostridia bacterium]
MFKTLANAWKIKDLRSKLLFTLLIILIYRIGTSVPVPFVSSTDLSVGSQTIFGFFNTLSGGAFEQGSLFALGVSPYITASIVVQLLTVAIPALERLSKLGEEGKRKINIITRYITIGISIVTAIGYYLLLKNNGALTLFASEEYWLFSAFVIITCYVAGSCLVMWLAEKINDKGIGNGISIILFANIVSRGAPLLLNFISMFKTEYEGYTLYGFYKVAGNGHVIGSTIFTILVLAAMLAMIWFVIFISESERRIPVQYAKRVQGRKMYGGQNSNIPLKVNMAGVMPIIFANAIITIPSTIAMFAKPQTGTFWAWLVDFCSSTSWFYALMQFILILAFAYFYVAISFNPTEVAGNIQKQGGAIPGIRPGKATSGFIQKVLSKVTFIGALSLSIISVVPLIVHLIVNAMQDVNIAFQAFTAVQELAFAGTSVVIVVGVIIETVREIEAQMTMRNYKGFLG